MSKTNIVMGVALACAGFVVGSAPGCGGSSSSANVTDLCNKGCDKEASCMPDAAATIGMLCKSACTSGTMGMTNCTNTSQIIAAYNSCLAMDCAGFMTCVQNLPACQGGGGGTNGGAGTNGGGGRGGASGSAGTTGSGGTSGSASCSICDKAGTCCVGVATQLGSSSSGCASETTAMCNAAGANQAQFIMACQTTLSTGAALGVAACM